MTGKVGGYFTCENVATIWRKMGRTKDLSNDMMQTPLNRCLTTFDIALLGIGHMVGAGIYVLVGAVAKDIAGPAIVISFLLAAFCSILSALCYAEFGARVPRAGSAYVYTYVTIGEFWAFIIGWNIILEHMIGAASVARAWSGYVDSLFNGAISNASTKYLGHIEESFLAPYPDPVAFFITLAYCSLLAFGVKGASYFNSFFTLINLVVIAFIIAVGIFYSDLKNWNTSGGFAPYGFSGILAGAASTFYAFVGFDSIATSGEEAINPSKSIPHATFISMGIVTVGYIFVSSVLTLMVPYYELNPAAAFPDAFAAKGLYWAKYIITVGALCGMTTTLFGGLFSLPRCLYAMATDGLLFSWLGKVSEKTQVPVLNMAISGIITAIIAMLLDIEKLVQFMSIGTLMAYTIVSASVIILRYQDKPLGLLDSEEDADETTALKGDLSGENSTSHAENFQNIRTEFRPMFQTAFQRIPFAYRRKMVSIALFVFILAVTSLIALIQWGGSIFQGSLAVLGYILIIFFLILLTLCTIVIACHRDNRTDLDFKVPFVPYVPLVSIVFNILLMLHLNPMTWLRFAIWVTLGLILYFAYGIRYSKEDAPVYDYTTLLINSNLEGEKALEAVQERLTQVTSKIISAANEVATGEKHKTEETVPCTDSDDKKTSKKDLA